MFKTLFKLSVLISTLFVMGCAAISYQPRGIRGGYSEEQLGENSYRVTYYGNGNVSAEQAMDFALLRASILLSEQHHQVIINELSVVIDNVSIGSGLYAQKPTARLNVSSTSAAESQKLVGCELLRAFTVTSLSDTSFLIDVNACINTIKTKYSLTEEQLAQP